MPLLVGGGEAADDLHGELDRLAAAAAVRQSRRCAQGVALEQFHHRVGRRRLSVPKSWMARMLGCDSAATACASRSKRASAVGIGGEVPGQDFDRDVAVQPGSRAR